jgi:hypothetical protein
MATDPDRLTLRSRPRTPWSNTLVGKPCKMFAKLEINSRKQLRAALPDSAGAAVPA